VDTAARAARFPGRAGDLVLLAAVVMGIGLRFFARSDLWLDEALSVNIATLDNLGDIFEALRHDGHPPLYYVLLHYWTAVFGDGDVAVRALSGVVSVASLPLAWMAGHRLAGRTGARWALALVALSPYWLRYSTETRMYALVMLMVLAGYLLLDSALRKPTTGRLVGLALLGGALLLTHYWAFWLLGAVGILLLARLWRQPESRGITLKVTVAVAAGGVLFLPWLPSFLYQSAHTGTPWAGPVRPLALVQLTLVDMGGGANLNESFAYAVAILIALAAGLFVADTSGRRLTLDLGTVPGVRPVLAVAGLTMAIGWAVSYAASSTFQPRYAAVYIPLLLLAVAAGLARLPTPARMAVGGTLMVLSLLGAGWHLYYHRAQSYEVALEIGDRAEPGDVVVYCPDQLGPAFSRMIDDDVVHLAYPALDDPALVDWVDYGERNAAADPAALADEILDRAGTSGDIFLVWKDGYQTFDAQCQQLLAHMGEGHFVELIVSENGSRYYEPAHVSWVQRD
jgi:mannosyltransferase